MSTPAYALTLEGSVEKTDAEGRIGIRVTTWGRIEKVHPGSPAEAAGLHKDDRVLLVDGKRHAVDEISGEPGTTVLLDVKRHHDRFQIAVERADVRSIAYY